MNSPWRQHPKLVGCFDTDNPDAVQVIVHDGGPRLTDHALEEVWVHLDGVDENDVFSGKVLSDVDQLSSVERGSSIKFIATKKHKLLLVTDKYLAERGDWHIVPCDQCGFDELLDAPTDLLHAVFPEVSDGAKFETFTAVCGRCGGAQTVMSKDALIDGVSDPSDKKWWQFWRNTPTTV